MSSVQHSVHPEDQSGEDSLHAPSARVGGLEQRDARALGKRVAYVRLSSVDRTGPEQMDDPLLDRVFIERANGHGSRPQFQACVEFLQAGDTLILQSLHRLARNFVGVREVTRRLIAKGVTLHFEKEDLTFSGESSAATQLLLSMLDAAAEFEQEEIRERQRDGIAAAKARGIYKGRKASLTSKQEAELLRRAQAGESKATLATDYGLTRQTIYNYIRRAT